MFPRESIAISRTVLLSLVDDITRNSTVLFKVSSSFGKNCNVASIQGTSYCETPIAASRTAADTALSILTAIDLRISSQARGSIE